MKKPEQKRCCGWRWVWCFAIGMAGAAVWPIARDYSVAWRQYWKAPRCPVCNAKLWRVWYERECPECQETFVSYCYSHYGQVRVGHAR